MSTLYIDHHMMSQKNNVHSLEKTPGFSVSVAQPMSLKSESLLTSFNRNKLHAGGLLILVIMVSIPFRWCNNLV